MAEILLKTNASSAYASGDVLCAFNRRRTRCVHAEHVCTIRKAGFNRDGLRPVATPAWDMRTVIHQYRFRRVSRTTIERVNQWTNEIDVFGSESIDVELFIQRRVKQAQHGIFGAIGSEIWFGGRVDVSQEKLDAVWEGITHRTGRREDEAEFAFWPMGRLDIREHLAVRVKDFDDAEAELMVRPIFELDKNGEPVLYDAEGNVAVPDKEGNVSGEPRILAKREQKIDWETQFLAELQVTKEQVLDPTYPVGETFLRGDNSVGYISKDQPEKQEIPTEVKPAPEKPVEPVVDEPVSPDPRVREPR